MRRRGRSRRVIRSVYAHGSAIASVKMASVPTLSFADARACVIERVTAARSVPAIDTVGLDCAAGRVLATEARADRDYPPLDRSVRDGFAVRAMDTPGQLTVIGEVRAGEDSALE